MSATADLIPVDPLVKVFRGETKLPSASPEADVAVGEHATIQIVFRSAKSVTNLRATVSGDVPGAVVRLVGYVKVGRPCRRRPARYPAFCRPSIPRSPVGRPGHCRGGESEPADLDHSACVQARRSQGSADGPLDGRRSQPTVLGAAYTIFR